MKNNNEKLKYIFLLGSLATCLMLFASIEAKSEKMTAPMDSTMTSGTVASRLSDSDLSDCDVLLGRKKMNVLSTFLDALKNRAIGGEVKFMKDYADILNNRFTCIESEITGNSTWLQYDQDKNGKITGESSRKIITSIRTNIVALNALKEAIAAYTAIADKDLGARIVLGDYYLRYREALGDIDEGYKLLSGANIVSCKKGNIDEADKFGCNLIEYKLHSYQKIIGMEKCGKLDELAEVWSNKYLEDIELAKEESAGETATVEDADVNDGKLIETAKLNGKDFELSAFAMSGDYIGYQNKYQKISIKMNNGKLLTDYTDNVSGKKLKIEEVGFAPGDVFNLKNMLPGEPREQLIVNGSEWFPRGEGIAENYTIYRVDDDGITELLTLLTKREFDGIEVHNRPAVHFSANVEEKLENKKLTIVYKYTNNNGKRHKLNFVWDGRKFTEKSGKYKAVKDLYEN